MIVMLLPGPWAQPARAQDTLTLVVRGEDVSPAARAELAAELAGAIDGTPGLLASVPAAPADPVVWKRAAEKARTLLAEAQERYRKFDGAGALDRLRALREALPAGCAGAGHRTLRAARLLEGLVHFTAGRREEADRVFASLAAMAPGWEPDPSELAPKIVAAFHEARRRVAARKPGILALDGSPRGASIELDGRAAGELPRVIEGVLPGRHCLEVRHPSHRPWAASVTVPEDTTVRLRVVLFPERALDLLDEGGVDDALQAGELARSFGTDYLVLVHAGEPGHRVRMIAAETGRIAGPGRCVQPSRAERVVCLHQEVTALHADLDATTAASAGRAPPEAVRPDQPAADVPPDIAVGPLPSSKTGVGRETVPADSPGASRTGSEPRWYQSWWFWTLVGGAALVGAGVGLGLALRPEDDATGYRVWITRPSR